MAVALHVLRDDRAIQYVEGGKQRRRTVVTCSVPQKLDRSKLEFSAVTSLGWEERKTMKASKFSDAQKAFDLLP
jgi:hypothetical protein